MTMKKYLACLLATLMMGAAFTACGETTTTEESSVEESSVAEESVAEEDEADDDADAEEESSAAEAVAVEVTSTEVEDAISAESGDAYLAITDEQWWIQYWGSATDASGYMLAYDAGVATITGDGSYTVSVTTETTGFHLDTDTGDEYTCGGVGFMAVIIKDGETACPDAVITIDSILVNGKEIEMTALGYTNTEEGAIRCNIYNPWVSSPTSDARCADGFLYNDYDTSSPALDNTDAFSAQIIDTSDFGSWTTIEVNFTITGMGGSSDSESADDADADVDADDADADVDADVADDEDAAAEE